MVVSQKITYLTWPSNPIPRCLPKRNDCMSTDTTNAHYNFILSSEILATTGDCRNQLQYIHTMEYDTAVKRNYLHTWQPRWTSKHDGFFPPPFHGCTHGIWRFSGQQLNPSYAKAMAILDASHICDLCHRLWQCWNLRPLSKARDWTSIPTDTTLCSQPAEPQGELPSSDS